MKEAKKVQINQQICEQARLMRKGGANQMKVDIWRTGGSRRKGKRKRRKERRNRNRNRRRNRCRDRSRWNWWKQNQRK